MTTPSGAINAQVVVVDTLTSQVATSIDIPAKYGTANKVVVRPNGSNAYVTTVGTGVNVIVIDTTTNLMTAAVPLQAAATADTQMAISSDGLALFVASRAELFLHRIETTSLTVARVQGATQPANSTEPKWGIGSLAVVD